MFFRFKILIEVHIIFHIDFFHINTTIIKNKLIFNEQNYIAVEDMNQFC